MPVDWVANMLEKAQGIYKINTNYDIPQSSTKCCMCYDNNNEALGDNGKLGYVYSLSAKDIQPRDMQHFQLHWSKGEPIIVSDVLSTSSGLSWEPMVLWRAFHDVSKRTRSHAFIVNAINCLDWSEVTVDLYKFFRGYVDGHFEKGGLPLILKLEDWQPSCLSQGEWPRHFVEFISCLPFKDYTHPHNGYLNVAVKLPDLSSKPDMGPRMDIAYGVEEEVEYGDSVTKLHCDKADTVNVLTHTQSAVLASTKLNQTNVVDSMEGGALWDIFHKQDVPKLKEYLRNHSAEFSHADCLSVEQIVHPIHDRIFYLNMEHKRKLKEEFGIKPWTFKQKLGDAVFIPAGCPYQVRNLKSCTKVELNFVSPESLGECILFQNELRMLPNNHRAKQQKLNISKMMIYALDHAVANLSGLNDDLQFDNVPVTILKSNDASICNRTNSWRSDTENDSQDISSSDRLPIKSAVKSRVSLDGSPILKANHTVDQKPITIENSDTSRESHPENIGLWRGLDVGPETKKLLQAVEHSYPNTFKGVKVRLEAILVPVLKEFHVIIKDFLDTPVDALFEKGITSIQEGLNDFDKLGFDLSWVHQRLNMVEKLKFGNDPLQQELVALEESLEPLNKRINERLKEFEEAIEMLKKARSKYDSTLDAVEKKKLEVAHKFGAEYDRVLKGRLGYGILPGY